MPTCFGLRKSQPRKSVTTVDCPYCGAAANLVRAVLHPELGSRAALQTFDCVDCGPWSELALGAGAQAFRAARGSAPARFWMAAKELMSAAPME
jgi:predicted RNA-binding Zn-ribbon protein involved in translation (DUF1610 family)